MISEITSKQQIDDQALSQSNRLKGSIYDKVKLKAVSPKVESKHYKILRKDQAWAEGYVGIKRSKYTKIHVKADLHRFYDFIIENYPAVKSILEVNPLQFRAYFEHIDQRPVRKNVKNKWRTNLKAFIFWIISPDLAQGMLPKINYEMIFSNKYYSFRESSGPREEDPLTREDVLECLNFFQSRNFRDFVLFSLLAYTGMRIGGLISLKIANINFQTRRIITQEKPTLVHSGVNEYCIPQKLMMDLEAFILEVQQRDPDQEKLFPVSPNVIRRQLHKWKVKNTHPHAFRDAINTRWQEMGMEESLRAILLNQQPSGINATHYLKKYRSWTERLGLYDQYFPY